MPQVAFQLTEEVYDFLRLECFKVGQPMADFIRQAINVQLKQQFGFEPSYQIGPAGRPSGRYKRPSERASEQAPDPAQKSTSSLGVLAGKSPAERVEFFVSQAWAQGELTLNRISESLNMISDEVERYLGWMGRTVEADGTIGWAQDENKSKSLIERAGKG